MDTSPDPTPRTTQEQIFGSGPGTDPGHDPAHDPAHEHGQVSAGREPQADQRLHRALHGRIVAGVAGGLAEFFDVDPTIVRVGFVALALLGGLAVPLYAAGWLLIPDEDGDVSVAEELIARERARSAY